MSKRWRFLLLDLLLTALLSASSVQAKEAQLPAAPTPARAQAPLQTDSSVLFVENVGQFAERARFQVWGGDRTVWLAEDGIWITVLEGPHPQPLSRRQERGEQPRPLFDRRAEETKPRRGVSLKLSFPGANPHPRLEPFNRLETHVSYFIGNDAAQWHPDVPVWGGLRYVDLYPGIDLELIGERGRLVQRMVARPGADLSAVRLHVDGADALVLDGDRLRVTTALGEVALPLLQVSGAAVPAGQPPAVVGNQVALPFVARMKPGASVLVYATFLGGTSGDGGAGIAVDGGGNAYVTGSTLSSDFPTTPGAFDTSYNRDYRYSDAFVAKLNPSGSALLYATFLGGSSGDYGYGIAVDGGGNAYVTGYTWSSDFPTTPGAFDTSHDPWSFDCAFVARLNPAGSALVYATFLEGSSSAGDEGWAIAVDGGGNASVTGYTQSSGFPTTPGAFDTSYNGEGDAFVARLNPAGSALLYATYLGSSSTDWAYGIAVDGGGNAYVTGHTRSSDFPTTPGAFDTSYNGEDDAFVARLNPAGSSLLYATFLGGSAGDFPKGIAVDGGGNAYVTGNTCFPDFPTTPGAFDTSIGTCDAFVTKLNPAGSALVYSTFLGGSGPDEGHGVAVDGGGNAYVTGCTWSSDFPTTPGAFDTSYNGYDAFVARLNPSGSALTYATFLGGSSYEWGSGIAVDGRGNAYITGSTDSVAFPTTPGAFDTSYDGWYWDAFVARLAM